LSSNGLGPKKKRLVEKGKKSTGGDGGDEKCHGKRWGAGAVESGGGVGLCGGRGFNRWGE